MPANYYIYYRILPADAARVRVVVSAVQSALEQATGVAGKLFRRSDDASTWMEVYESVEQPQAFESELERLLEEHNFAACLAPKSSRHIERFIACV